MIDELQMVAFVLIGFTVGMIAMYKYMCSRLHEFGWDWKMITSKISEDEYRKKFTEDR